MRYMPVSSCVHMFSSTADQVASVKALFLKNVIKRMMEMTRPLLPHRSQSISNRPDIKLLYIQAACQECNCKSNLERRPQL